MAFAPAGITDDPEIKTASSLVDYIFKRLAANYLSFDDRLELGLASIEDMTEDQTSLLDVTSTVEINSTPPVQEDKTSDPAPQQLSAAKKGSGD